MSEVAAALEVLLKPAVLANKFFIVEPFLQVVHFLIDFVCRYGLDSDLGHLWVFAVLNPALTYVSSQLFHQRRFMHLFGHFHQPECFAISFRIGHTEIAILSHFGIDPFLMTDDDDGLPIEATQAANDRFIIFEIPVAVHFNEFPAHLLDVK